MERSYWTGINTNLSWYETINQPHMNKEEEALKAEYKEAGIDLPELQGEPKAPEEEKPQEAPAANEPAPEEPAPKMEEPKDEEPKAPEPLQPPKEPKKRSVYDALKQHKQAERTERELRVQAERERDELKKQLEKLSNASTPQERQDANDDIEALAQEIGADPAALRKLRDVLLKNAQPNLDPQVLENINRVLEWQSQNAQAIEAQEFEQEFQATLPTIKELFPAATADELKAIREQVDAIAHSEGWNDKPLDYVIFKHKEVLGALVSPKKRGIEPKGRVNNADDVAFTFDPNADLSKMSPQELEKWQKEYDRLTKSEDGMLTDAEGARTIL